MQYEPIHTAGQAIASYPGGGRIIVDKAPGYEARQARYSRTGNSRTGNSRAGKISRIE